MGAFYQNNVVFSYNNQLYVGSNTQVTVYITGTTSTANIYYDPNLTSSKPNPFIADQNGYFSFYIDDGVYDFQMVYSSGNINLTSSVSQIVIVNPQDYYWITNTSTSSVKLLYPSKGLVLYDTSTQTYYRLQVDQNQIGLVPLGSVLNL